MIQNERAPSSELTTTEIRQMYYACEKWRPQGGPSSDTIRRWARLARAMLRRLGTGGMLCLMLTMLLSGCSSCIQAAKSAQDAYQVYQAAVVPHPQYPPREAAEVLRLGESIEALLREAAGE